MSHLLDRVNVFSSILSLRTLKLPLLQIFTCNFDFIQKEDGTVYPIECNPRIHSAINMFYNHPGVADAYLNDADHLNQQERLGKMAIAIESFK